MKGNGIYWEPHKQAFLLISNVDTWKIRPIRLCQVHCTLYIQHFFFCPRSLLFLRMESIPTTTTTTFVLRCHPEHWIVLYISFQGKSEWRWLNHFPFYFRWNHKSPTQWHGYRTLWFYRFHFITFEHKLKKNYTQNSMPTQEMDCTNKENHSKEMIQK